MMDDYLLEFFDSLGANQFLDLGGLTPVEYRSLEDTYQPGSLDVVWVPVTAIGLPGLRDKARTLLRKHGHMVTETVADEDSEDSDEWHEPYTVTIETVGTVSVWRKT